MRRAFSIFLGAALLSSASAEALTLKQALEAAYQSNPEIMASRARLAATGEGYNLAKSQNDLTMDLEGFYGASRRNRSTIFSNRTIQEEDVGGELGLSLTKPLYQGGRVKALKAKSKADIEAARQTLRATQQKVFLEATTAYIDTVFDQEVVELNREHIGILDELKHLVVSREEIGIGTETDIWRIQSRYADVESGIIQAETKLGVSQSIFEQVIGKKPTNISWNRSLSVPSGPEAALRMARTNNPQLFEALSREDSAKAAIDVAKSGDKPTLAVVGNSFITDERIKDFDKVDVDGVTVGLNLRVPLLSGGGTSSRVRAAKHELAGRKFETAMVERSINSAVKQAWTRYQGAQTVRDSVKNRMDNSAKTYKNVGIEFDLGTRTIFDVVDAEQDYLFAQVQYLESRREAEQAAAMLLASMGMTDTIPHVQQVLPTIANQATDSSYASIVESDAPVELARSIPIAGANKPVVHKVVPQNPGQVFASQTQTDSPVDLGRRLRTRAVPRTMTVPTTIQAPKLSYAQVPQPKMQQVPVSRAEMFSSLRGSDAPGDLGRYVRARPAPVSRQEIFRSVLGHDAPSALRRTVPVRPAPVIMQAPAQVIVRPAPVLRPSAFRHQVD